ncbi:hypothetical protein LJR090_003170 [Bosea sp. LjRoot90]|uniref:hypothetical protein n=1 Tax=Bosea sp. LjRoot90 TaxID=3342342 RepID=UPI003ECFB9C8
MTICVKAKRIALCLLALGWSLSTGAPAAAQTVEEVLKTPCSSNETGSRLWRLNDLGRLIPYEHPVEYRVGQVKFRVPWAFVRTPLSHLNCPQSRDGWLYFFFWMPDRKPPARETNVRLVGHEVYQPPEPGRMRGRDHLVRVVVNPPSKPGERLAWTVPDRIKKAGGVDALPHEFGMLRLPVYGGISDKSASRNWVQLSERQIVSLNCSDRRGTNAPSTCRSYVQTKDPDFDLTIDFLDEHHLKTIDTIDSVRDFLLNWRISAGPL